MHPWSRNHSPGLRAFSLLLAVSLVLLSLPGCRRKQPGPTVAPVQVTIAWSRNISASLAILGIEKGYFSRQGARVVSLPFESGKAALERMLAGGADLAVVAETPIAKAILENGQLKVLASIRQSNHDLAIVARNDRGVHAPADLRGKVVGYTKGTAGHYFLDTYCLVNRIALSDDRLIDLSPLQLRSALLDGRVDAVSIWEPHVAVLTEALGPQAVVFREESIYTQNFCVVARPEFIRDHPEQVKAVLEGLFSALDFITRSPAEARELVASYTQVAPSLVSMAFSGHDFDVRLDQALILSIGSECHWFLDSGTVPKRDLPDVLTYFHLEGLLEVRPQAVQIIRDAERGHR